MFCKKNIFGLRFFTRIGYIYSYQISVVEEW